MKKLLTGIGVVAAATLLAVGCSNESNAQAPGYRGGRSTELVDAGPNAEAPAARRTANAPEQAAECGSERTDERTAAQPADRGAPWKQEAGTEVSELLRLAGTLLRDGEEWMLESPEGTVAVHFGNPSYVESTGIELREGEAVSITGFESEDGIAVVSCELGSRTFAFRDESGAPLWRGSAGANGGNGKAAGRGGNGNSSRRSGGNGGRV
jgi:hypothetical protein